MKLHFKRPKRDKKTTMSATKSAQDVKKEEFRKYLDKGGVIELLTKGLVALYEEPEKPSDAVSFLKNSMGAGIEEKAQVEELKKENDELKAKIKELEESNSQLELKIKEGSAPTPVVAAEPSPVAETPAEKLEEETKKDKESEETKDDEKKEEKADEGEKMETEEPAPKSPETVE